MPATRLMDAEQFTILIEPKDERRGTLTMAWGTFRWTAPIVVQ
ncbi:hypothetical protein BH24GEM1_BH24GEM1_25160 [soil metagenome]